MPLLHDLLLNSEKMLVAHTNLCYIHSSIRRRDSFSRRVLQDRPAKKAGVITILSYFLNGLHGVTKGQPCPPMLPVFMKFPIKKGNGS